MSCSSAEMSTSTLRPLIISFLACYFFWHGVAHAVVRQMSGLTFCVSTHRATHSSQVSARAQLRHPPNTEVSNSTKINPIFAFRFISLLLLDSCLLKTLAAIALAATLTCSDFDRPPLAPRSAVGSPCTPQDWPFASLRHPAVPCLARG